MSEDLRQVQKALIGLTKRAEREADARLAETFVDAEPLFTVLSTTNNQIIYGRRGTGKTHALKYLQGRIAAQGGSPIYIDLRHTGSNTSIYADFSLPFSQRATSICNDILTAIHDELLSRVVANKSGLDLSVCGPILDRLADAIANTKVMGNMTVTAGREERERSEAKIEASMALSASPALSGGFTDTREREGKASRSVQAAGTETLSLIFGDVGRPLADLSTAMRSNIWALIDEWSEIPSDLQPLLADLIRRALLPVSSLTVKIAAIEHRSAFSKPTPGGGYLGFELGADVGADLNLDDFMVFENDANRASEFFSNLLFRHYMSSEERGCSFASPAELRGFLFTQVTAFDEFVRAVEGVPRDAIYLISILSQKAFGHDFSVADVRTAAREWYLRDKAPTVAANPELQEFLAYLIEEVIGH